MADWWKPDPETRRALRRGKEAMALARYRSSRWVPAEEFDREDSASDGPIDTANTKWNHPAIGKKCP